MLTRTDRDALGYAAATAHRRASGHQHPQHVLTALARLAQTGEPVSGARQQLRRIRARAQPGDEKRIVMPGALTRAADRDGSRLSGSQREALVSGTRHKEARLV